MVVDRSARTRLGVAAHPDTGVDGVDRPAVSQRMSRQQRLDRRRGELTDRERIIQTPPAAGMLRLQAQMGQ
jgi:hypothetical protein